MPVQRPAAGRLREFSGTPPARRPPPDRTLCPFPLARVPFFPVRFNEQALARFPDVDIDAAWSTQWDQLPIAALVTIDAQPADRQKLEAGFESSWIAMNQRVELWRRR